MSEQQWYAATPDGATVGPLAKPQLLAQVRSGRVPRESKVCPVGASTWLDMQDEPEFSRALRRAPTVVNRSAGDLVQKAKEQAEAAREAARKEMESSSALDSRDRMPSETGDSRPSVGGLLVPGQPARKSSPSSPEPSRSQSVPPPLPQSTLSEGSISGAIPQAKVEPPGPESVRIAAQNVALAPTVSAPAPAAAPAPAVAPQLSAEPDTLDTLGLQRESTPRVAWLGVLLVVPGFVVTLVGTNEPLRDTGLGIMLLGVATIAFAAARR